MQQIPPGGEGQITVTVKTDGYGGKYVREGVRVQTNDPERPWLEVVVAGQVETFALIDPARVTMVGKIGDALKDVVRIRPRPEKPFKITGVQNTQGDKFIRYRLVEASGNEGYRLEVENASTQKGTYYDQIVLQTDSTVRPEIKIPVIGRLS